MNCDCCKLYNCTNTSGPEFGFVKNITWKTYLHICDKIASELNDAYGTNFIKIVPEPITEGGMMFRGGCFDEPHYKSIRLNIPNYPWINDVNGFDADKVIVPRGIWKPSVLKAFHDTSPWTWYELGILLNVFEQNGIIYRKVPPKEIFDNAVTLFGSTVPDKLLVRKHS